MGMAVNKEIIYKLFLFGCLLILSNIEAIGQSNFLKQRVSISAEALPIKQLLSELEKQTDCHFSYNTSFINENRLVTLEIEQLPLQKALNRIFRHQITCKVVGSHVVLLPRKEQKQKEMPPHGYIITGKVIDHRTGVVIRQATVYEVNGKLATLTDSMGRYELSLPEDQEIKGVSFSKQGYRDTIIMVKPVSSRSSIEVAIQPAIPPSHQLELARKETQLATILFHEQNLIQKLVPIESQIIANNLTIYNQRMGQISLLPYIGTNKNTSGAYTNKISYNLLAGYAGGVNGVEIGTIANIIRNDVQGFQLSGFANFVGGDSKYVQIAGALNKNSGQFQGLQLSGFASINLDTLRGIQISGFHNMLHGAMHGLQLSGFNNVTTQNVEGVQVTGFINIAAKDVKLLQLSGFGNWARSVDAIQIAGFANRASDTVNAGQIAGAINTTKHVRGAQIAGMINIAKEKVTGLQLSGLINYTKELNGLQIAPINIADSVGKGTPFGILSFVPNGLHEISLFTSKTLPANLCYKMGVPKFFTTWNYATDFNNYHTTGMGLGTRIILSNSFNLDLIYQSQMVASHNFKDIYGNVFQFIPELHWRPLPFLSFFAAPEVNYMELEKTSDESTPFAPYSMLQNDNNKQAFWISARFGVAFQF